MARWLPWSKKGVPAPASSASPDESGATSESSTAVAVLPDTVTKETSWRRGLSRLRRTLMAPLDRLRHGQPLSHEIFDSLEEVLIEADVGVQTTTCLIERLRERCQREHATDANMLRGYLREEILTLLRMCANPPLIGETRPWVILMIGVNGVGKTTTIAKLAARFTAQGKKVLLVAADTFRAAAIEQLEVWARRLSVDLIKHKNGASPAAVAFDGVRAAIARDIDIVIIDTAGRLHTKAPLMEELKKIHRVVARELPGAPQETLLVLDASTGQNALSQVRTFQQALPLSGVILTKMDGSAKGGIVLALGEALHVPIRCVGLGEQATDLQDFVATDFVDALFAL